MDKALASLITSGAGNGAPTLPSSRYQGSANLPWTLPDGTEVMYLARRILPRSSIYQALQSYVVVEGDRLDNLAARFLGDPLLFWMICDANNASDPDALTAQVGRSILIPQSSGIPPGARYG
ncbi:LysM peptidoglycan-binding domain-containing protein [Dyella subtropica]|uniref:LysM peptidoglycan-binding domain-containing protein n=1 Tax=Dyella subtropica TaxID=2992127 RepID=UPI002252297F|nr:LysM domain-containing protein [Dyella subtropica]